MSINSIKVPHTHRLTERQNLIAMVELRKRAESPAKVVKTPAKSAAKKADNKPQTWGRSSKISFWTNLGLLCIFMFCPLLVVYFWMACASYQCSLTAPILLLQKAGFSWVSVQSVIVKHLPVPTQEGSLIFVGWLLFQAALYELMPSNIGYGQRTPAGHLLPYKVNGLRVWVFTHLLFLGATWFGYLDAAVIYKHWGALLVAANVYGYFLTAFAYVKALLFPTHPDDCKWSGSFLYDMFMGVEFNPRFGKYFDFKLFHNGRPGILAWTLINWSFAAAQYQQLGYVTNSMLLVNWLHFCYVIDFFINEDWYLRTVDIAHDHFGFYLAWGDSVWLPFMYTLQSHYLVKNPVQLPWWGAAAVFAMGMFGYYIFRAVNHQKDIVRRADGNCMIWGKPAKFIRANYTTLDGKKHSSILLASGWWGIARHFNYTGDLILSFAMCAACGFNHLLPFFYIIYMAILLVNRIGRDDARCSGKYGKYWDDYKKAVPYALIPYIY